MSGKTDKIIKAGAGDTGADQSPNRRALLKGAALAGVGAAASVPLAVTSAEAAESPSEQIKARYRETDHIKRYYYLNRL